MPPPRFPASTNGHHSLAQGRPQPGHPHGPASMQWISSGHRATVCWLKRASQPNPLLRAGSWEMHTWSRSRSCTGQLGFGWRPFLGQVCAGRAAEAEGRSTGGGNMRFLEGSLISQIPFPGSFQISCASSLNLCDNPPVFLSSKSECVFDCFLSLGAS